MTKEEIKALIVKAISQQGNQSGLDHLDRILNAIVDKMPEQADLDNYARTVEVDDFEDFDKETSYEAGAIVRNGGVLFTFIDDKDPGPWDTTKVEPTNVLSIIREMLPVAVTVSISALQSADLTAEQASAAGFDALAIEALKHADNPTVRFSDMCVTFNAAEVISDDLVNQSALVVHTAVGGGTLHKCILSVYTDGRIVYTVTDIV